MFINVNDFKVDKRVINYSGEIRIALSKAEYWQQFLTSIYTQNAKQFKERYVGSLSKKLGLGYNETGQLLYRKALEIEEQTKKVFADCIKDAYDFHYS